jgi:TonB-linked SusC/RagA family outer membrane protein
MRLTTFILLIALLHASASSLAQQVTLHEKQASMQKVLSDIEKQSGYNVFYGDQVLKNVPLVNVDLNNVPLEDALNACFKGQPLSFKIIQQTIVVKRKDEVPFENPAAPLPPHDIFGRVTTTHNLPLNGASVTIKRTQTGVLTDANGNFTLRSVNSSDTLVVSYVGYGRQYFPIGNQTILKIVLKESSNSLDEVVVQAYGETSQRLATGDIGTVSAAEIAKHPVMNVLEALQGQIPGVIVTNTSGYASSTIKVEIRGRNTINPNFPSDPLYVIDGVPLTISDLTGNSSYVNGAPSPNQSGIASYAGGQSPELSLNPADIESISVLKDADATSIYGSRGANGVILITTKKGKAGKTHTNVSVTQGVSEITERYQLLNTQQYFDMREDALKNDNLPVNIINAPDLITGGTTRYTNWENYFWGGTGNYTDAEVSMSGGDTQTTFRIAAGYHDQRDITTISGGNGRASFSINLDHKSLDQRLDISLTTNYSYVFTNQIGEPNSPNLPPNAPAAFAANGTLNFAPWDALYNGPNEDPFLSLLQPYFSSTNFINSNLLIKYEIFKGLTFNASLGYNESLSTQTLFYPIASKDPATNPTGNSQFGKTVNDNIIIEPHLEYSTLIGKGKLNVLLGSTTQTGATTSTYIGGNGFNNDALLQDISAAANSFGNYLYGADKYAGFFTRFNYNWEDKYILNLNARRDGSSRFGPGRQYGNFASVGGAYIFSEESWFKNNLTFLSLGKLRASYGTTGSDEIGNYQYLTQWSFGNYPYNGIKPLTPDQHTDSLLHWQVNRKLELGLDLALLKDRITFSISWYEDRCNDQLVYEPLPSFTGFSSVLTNIPADVQNTGLEFVLGAKVVDNTDFKWTSHFNIGFNRNKLLAYPDLAQSPYAYLYTIGQSLNSVRLLHYTGVDPLTGLYTFADLNHDGQITYNYSNHTNDDTYSVDLAPKFDGSFTNSFTYNNWALSFMVYFKKQMARNAFYSLDIPGDNSNQPLQVIQNVWQKPGDVAQYARLTTNFNQSYIDFPESDGEYTDASFIRLQNLQLSYTLPKISFFKGVESGSVFIRGDNLLVLTPYKGPDPEIDNFSGLPLPLTITLGISLTL